MIAKLTLTLLALLSGGLMASAEAVPALMVADDDGLRPIAIYESGKFFPPATEPGQQAVLGQDLLGRAHELPLFHNGETRHLFRFDSFRVSASECKGAGHWPGQSEPALAGPLLAFTPDFPGARRYIGNYPSGIFDKVAKESSRKLLLGHKVPAARLSGLQIKRIEPFTLQNGTRVLAAVESEIPGSKRECPEYSQFLLIEKIGRRYQTVLERFNRNQGSCTGTRMLGSFATSQVIDKLVLQGHNASSAWYDIYQLQSFGKLSQIYHGGGHSCH